MYHEVHRLEDEDTWLQTNRRPNGLKFESLSEQLNFGLNLGLE